VSSRPGNHTPSALPTLRLVEAGHSTVCPSVSVQAPRWAIRCLSPIDGCSSSELGVSNGHKGGTGVGELLPNTGYPTRPLQSPSDFMAGAAQTVPTTPATPVARVARVARAASPTPVAPRSSESPSPIAHGVFSPTTLPRLARRAFEVSAKYAEIASRLSVSPYGRDEHEIGHESTFPRQPLSKKADTPLSSLLRQERRRVAEQRRRVTRSTLPPAEAGGPSPRALAAAQIASEVKQISDSRALSPGPYRPWSPRDSAQHSPQRRKFVMADEPVSRHQVVLGHFWEDKGE